MLVVTVVIGVVNIIETIELKDRGKEESYINKCLYVRGAGGMRRLCLGQIIEARESERERCNAGPINHMRKVRLTQARKRERERERVRENGPARSKQHTQPTIQDLPSFVRNGSMALSFYLVGGARSQ